MIDAKGEAGFELPLDATRLYLSQAMEKIEASARKIIAAVAEGDMLRTQMAMLRRLAKHDPYNTVELRQGISQKILEQGKYFIV
jgi:butyryl-CoA dehydrogenase